MSWNYCKYVKYPESSKPGHKRLPKEQVDKIVERLNVVKEYHEGGGPTPARDDKKLSQEEVESLFGRLADRERERTIISTRGRQRIFCISFTVDVKIAMNYWTQGLRNRVCSLVIELMQLEILITPFFSFNSI
ncbi:predicted protein [Nematostella vectensis]|uniref:Uncharacterized protein n=1 Tax=Nematostella vectensis TaxID=45351 RepID=A7RLT3_NEMVE|nr:predicted protein [Nematostella vectensis]|eukprot:XP_001639813.1 predicted protein [Nematostella vectensis]